MAVASSCLEAPNLTAGRTSTTLATHSTLGVQVPDDMQNGFPSAKSQLIGIACRAIVFRNWSFDGLESHVQIVEWRSTTLSTANAKYVATAFAYTILPSESTSTRSCTSLTRLLKAVNAMSCRGVKRS